MPKWLEELNDAAKQLFGIDVAAFLRVLFDNKDPQRKDASMNDTPNKGEGAGPEQAPGQALPVHRNYEHGTPPVGWLTLTEDDQALDLEGLVIAPEGLCDEDGKITELTGFGVFPAERLRRREGMVRLPVFGTGQEGEPVGYIEIPEHLAEPGIRNFVARPIVEFENGNPTKAVGFELVHPETLGGGVPVTVGHPEGSEQPVVGVVRISGPMTFQYGNLKDLQLHPRTDEGGEVTGYRVVPSEDPVRRLHDLPPGQYIFHHQGDGQIGAIGAIPERHIVELRERSFSLEHPYECRAGGKSLHDCPTWGRVTEKAKELRERGVLGRFYVELDEENDRLVLEDVHRQEGGDLVKEEPGA